MTDLPPLPRSKRIMDIVFAGGGMVVLALPFAVLVMVLLLAQGRPLFHLSERMMTPHRAFRLWKLRSMTVVALGDGICGGDMAGRITPMGRWLRRYRLDELPQLWNVLRGNMTMVGPRPPLRRYVDAHPDLYAQVLRARPGMTGLASLMFHAREEALLRGCRTAEETHQVYTRRCIPAKARLDILYHRSRSMGGDVMLIWQTLWRLGGGGLSRAHRRRSTFPAPVPFEE